MKKKRKKMKMIKFNSDVHVNLEQIAYVKTRYTYDGFNVELTMSNGNRLEHTFARDDEEGIRELLGL